MLPPTEQRDSNQYNLWYTYTYHWKQLDTNEYGFFTFIYKEETKFVEDFMESRPWSSFTQEAAKPHGYR